MPSERQTDTRGIDIDNPGSEIIHEHRLAEPELRRQRQTPRRPRHSPAANDDSEPVSIPAVAITEHREFM